MSAKSILVALAAALAATTAQAAEKGARPPPPTGGAFDLTPVAIPVVVGGQVRNYVFVTVRLTPVESASVPALRLKEAFIRDALVRAAHRTPFTLATDYNSVDAAKIVATLTAQMPALAGKGQVKTVAVSLQQPRNIVRAPKS